MKKLFLPLLLALPSLLPATVITFDDLPNGTSAPPVPSNYAGVTWDASWFYWTPIGTPAKSDPNIAYFNQANDAGFNFAAPVSFDGAWFSGFTQPTSVQFDLFLSNTLVHSSSLLALTQVSTFLDAGYLGDVDRVQIHIVGGLTQWVVDDITFNAPSGVPEPSTLVLLPVGLGAVLAFRRKRAAH